MLQSIHRKHIAKNKMGEAEKKKGFNWRPLLLKFFNLLFYRKLKKAILFIAKLGGPKGRQAELHNYTNRTTTCMHIETETETHATLFSLSKWLAACIAGACAQRRRRRRRRRRRTTWRPYPFLQLIPSIGLQRTSLIFHIHVTNDSRGWSNVFKIGLHWSKRKKIKITSTTESKN